jgi:TolB-like protein
MTEPEADRPAGEGSVGPSSFLAELKQRRVFRAAAAYAVVAWGATEILDGVVSRLGWPDWIATLVVIVFVVGFPVAMFLAWAFDWTREGIRRAEPWTAKGWLSIALATAFLVVGSAGLFWLINPSGVARIEQVGVAVLPCRYRGDPAFAFRAEGAARVVHEDLATSPGLFVPDFDAVVESAGWNLPTRDLGHRLGVAWLVECRLVQAGEVLTLEATITQTSTDESGAVASREVPTLEMLDAVSAVSAALRVRLGLPATGEGGSAITRRYPPIARALDAYFQGEQAARAGTGEALREARARFREAQAAPGFHLARAREADVVLALFEAEPPDTPEAARVALSAVGLMLTELERTAADLPETFAASLRLAGLQDRFGDGPGAEVRRAWFERAVDLKPNSAEAYSRYADYLAGTEGPDAAGPYAEKARQLLGVAGDE